jgi:DNA-binding beta-propeller fold protein YncE
MIPRRKLSVILAGVLIFTTLGSAQNNRFVLTAPAGNLYTHIDKEGTTIVPNGRLITPTGRTIAVAPHPFGLVISRDGTIAVTANSGIEPLSISVIKNVLGIRPEVMQIPPGAVSDKGVLASVFMGLAISPDNASVYVAGGQKNTIYIFNTSTGVKVDSIDCSTAIDGQKYPDGYIGDLVISRNGKYLFAVDQMRFRLVIVDTDKRTVVGNVPVGRYPFGVALSPDEEKVYVANVGMFEYRKIDSIEDKKDYAKALRFPAFAFGSREMKEGTRIDSLDIPGLGDPNAPESFSVWAVSIHDMNHPVVVSKVKTGTLVGEKVEGVPAVGGSSPNSLVATSRYVFVSNGNNDNISVIDSHNDRVLREITLSIHDAVKHLRGIIPFGLAISPDERRLYVAEAGINAIGVIDIPSLSLIGHIPAGWFPSKLKVSGDGKKLVVANAKGYGSGPNGGKSFHEGPEGTYIGNLMRGTVSVIDVPADSELPPLTGRVVRNNYKIESMDTMRHAVGKNPIPVYGGEKKSPIKHIVFISKENRTYDEVFGQLTNGNGDASLARYGKHVSFSNRGKTQKVENAIVMANHLKLAESFAVADNFYVDSDVSADGHRWLVNTYPNEWVEVTTPASYGGNRAYTSSSKAPGSLAMNNSAGAIYPEDYNEAGSMWEHLERHAIDFYNFGFGVMFEPAFYHQSYKRFGIGYFANYPMPAPMFTRTSKMYPTFNMAIPDQFRASQFIKEFEEKWGAGKKPMPPVVTLILPNDHGAGERPEAGYPFRESYMVDNDLALGRIVEFLSHTRYWKTMAVVVTEDDAQSGVDHIDAHRSILMIISPYAKRNYVSTIHYSFGSIFKTIWNVLGLPYLNQYDAAATDLGDMFTPRPDFRPYAALPADGRIFDPQKALTPLDEKFDWKALEQSPKLDNPEDMLNDQKEKKEYRIEDHRKKK